MWRVMFLDMQHSANLVLSALVMVRNPLISGTEIVRFFRSLGMIARYLW